MYIIGIEPKSPGLNVFSQTYAPRLGLPRLLTMAKNLGHQAIIYCEEICSIDWSQIKEADLILISSTTSTTPRTYDLVKQIRQINQSAPILMGGPHVTFLPEEALRNGADYVFRHGADNSFRQWLEWYTTSRDPQELSKIQGLSYRQGDIYQHTPRPGAVDLNSLPTPDLDLIAEHKPRFVTISSSEGCPYGCDFCSEWAMHGRNYRFRSPANVITDIRYYRARYGNKISFFFGDDNLAAHPQRLRQLCELIIEEKLVGDYSGQVRLDIAKHPDLLKLMNRAGFSRVYIGYESVNPVSLEAIGKKLPANQMADWTKIIHRAGISIHAMWVLGFDQDSLETIRETVAKCIAWGIETNQFLILVPIPGSLLFERLTSERRIINTDWSKYDGHHVVFQPKAMSARQLQIAVMLEAMPKIYNFGQTWLIFIQGNLRTMRRLFSFRSPHPFSEFRNNALTLVFRLWGQRAVKRISTAIRSYTAKLTT